MDQIEPSRELIQTAKRRMQERIARKVYPMNKNLHWKRLAPIAACLIMVVAVAAFFGNSVGLFGSKVYTAELDGGTLNFRRSTAGAGNMAFELGIDGTARNLTAGENHLLFGEAFGASTISSHGFFSIGDQYGPDGSLLHVEAMALNEAGDHIGGMKIILAATSLGYVPDTLIETKRNISEINGVQVSAGYWISRENSRGERNIVYLASYETESVTVYVECGGSLDRNDEIRAEIAFAIDTLTRNGTPNMAAITD
jgi:hypothetical protein